MSNHVYLGKDGRTRCYDEKTQKVTSYPRKLMEQSLGRPLESYEQVHHIDGNKNNNNISNLQVINIGEHQKLHAQKYKDKEAICPWCGKTFIWTALQQRRYNQNKSRRKKIDKPFCSKSCCSSYGRQEQLSRNAQAECS